LAIQGACRGSLSQTWSWPLSVETELRLESFDYAGDRQPVLVAEGGFLKISRAMPETVNLIRAAWPHNHTDW
jgi:hypothetical protein